jgi:hypothetical protein
MNVEACFGIHLGMLGLIPLEARYIAMLLKILSMSTDTIFGWQQI